MHQVIDAATPFGVLGADLYFYYRSRKTSCVGTASRAVSQLDVTILSQANVAKFWIQIYEHIIISSRSVLSA